MLEEIRIKVMSRVSKSRAFADTWIDEISPMAMMVFNTDITRSMQSWELKGIPCVHGIAAMNHLNMDASQAISSWYRKETYLKKYSHFIQPVPIWKCCLKAETQ
ncbi:hypothetical protein H5410_041803 [Solanum commersonii]|uniref:Zinc finger PMZ-type domain-containing protein n=1 Tax=Solanum commersonii TaxID=4109 RepID=A0A9J5XSX9_SOLCO|nr:hypothetical protein H5410_041803 [Solanum commersonii]